MRWRPRNHYTEEDEALMRDRWRKGQAPGFNAHELRQLYRAVPGYPLRFFPRSLPNEVDWLIWLGEGKATSDYHILFAGAPPGPKA